MKKYCIGIDVGGTTIKCGIFKTDGSLLEKWEIPTDKKNGGERVIPDAAESVSGHLKGLGIDKSEVEGIGIGVPGPVGKDGIVPMCVNLGWGRKDPAGQMKECFGDTRCFAGNDANVAALGEQWMGAGKGYQSLVMVTLGTGVGGGYIQDGKIISGSHGAGAEIGHMHIRNDDTEKCTCGAKGCLEQTSSARGIAREAENMLSKYDGETGLRDLKGRITAKDVCDLAKKGDDLALKALTVSMHYLGEALAHVALTSDPEAFVIGGGVSKAGDLITDLMKETFDKYTKLIVNKPDFIIASLGNDAGIYGAARLVL